MTNPQELRAFIHGQKDKLHIAIASAMKEFHSQTGLCAKGKFHFYTWSYDGSDPKRPAGNFIDPTVDIILTFNAENL